MGKEKLTMIELFAGIGSQIRGTDNTGLWDGKVLNVAEINKDAMVSYAAVHCGLTPELVANYDDYPSREEMAQYLIDRNIGYDFKKNKPFDWMKLVKQKNNILNKYYLACILTGNLGDISGIPRLDYADFWTYSFPCFTGNTLVYTKEQGYIPIKDVQLGMSVLTHTNTYKPVLKAMQTGTKNVYSIKAACCESIECTENHKFYVRTKKMVLDAEGDPVVDEETGEEQLYFETPVWKEYKALKRKDYLGYAVNQNSVIPVWNDGTDADVELKPLMGSADLWWLLGRYVSAGYLEETSEGILPVIKCGLSGTKLSNLMEHLETCGFPYTLEKQETYQVCRINVKALTPLCNEFEDKEYEKCIPSFVLDMPVELCEEFLKGYLDITDKVEQFALKPAGEGRASVYAFCQLVAKVCKRPFALQHTKWESRAKYGETGTIKRDIYIITLPKSDSRHAAFYEDGYIWYPITEFKDLERVEPVYDLTVDTDHSFTTNGVIVHNCQDISVAGKQKGLVKGQTRSGLLYEVERLLETAKAEGTLPKYLLLENVKNLVGTKFIDSFNAWLSTLDTLGYNTYWQVLNSKDCGIPQNRERVFAVSIRKDIDKGTFVFPKPFDLGLRLRDLLEKQVDDRYYLSPEIQSRFTLTDKTFTKTIIGTTMPDFRSVGQRDRVYQKDSVMATLTHTEYKQPKQILDNQEECQQYIDNLPESQSFVKRGAQQILDETGTLPEMFNAYNSQGIEDYAPTQTTTCGSTTSSAQCLKKEPNYRIRKLTPTECWRLMGFRDEDIAKASALGLSDTALYEQAGNSIVTNCIALIMEHLYTAQIDSGHVCFDTAYLMGDEINFTQPQ